MCRRGNRRGIRLKGSGSMVDPADLPELFIDAISESFADEKDPYTILATYAYIFCGLKINDIRDMFILSDRYGVRKASREYIRQKIVGAFKNIRSKYTELHGDNAPVSSVEDYLASSMIGSAYSKHFAKEEEYIDDQTETKEQVQAPEKGQAHTRKSNSSGVGKGWDSNGDRPGNEKPRMGSI